MASGDAGKILYELDRLKRDVDDVKRLLRNIEAIVYQLKNR